MRRRLKPAGWFIIILLVAVAIFGCFAIAKLIFAGEGTTGKGKAVSLNRVATAGTADPVAAAPAAEAASEAEEISEAELTEIKDTLKVDLKKHELEGLYTEYSKTFLQRSTTAFAEQRVASAKDHGWSGDKMYDAVSFPFSVTSKDKKYNDDDIKIMRDELKEEIMRNPVVGDMICQGMAEMKLPDGTSVQDLNEWASDLVKKYDEEGVNGFLTYHTTDWQMLGYEPEPRTAEFIYGDDGKKKLFVTDEYAEYAKMILIFLDRCSCLGVEKVSTTRHYPLTGSSDPNAIRTYLNKDKSYVDTAPALLFGIELKDGRQVLKFGFNLFDKRLELFEAKKTTTSVTPVPTKPAPSATATPTPTPGDNPTPTPDDPTPTPDDPTPTPRDQKNPKDDAVHKDNAEENGGEGNGGTGDPTEPGDGQGHGDPGETKPDEPTPKPGGGNDDSNPPGYGEEDHGQPPVGGENPPGDEITEPPIASIGSGNHTCNYQMSWSSFATMTYKMENLISIST